MGEPEVPMRGLAQVGGRRLRGLAQAGPRRPRRSARRARRRLRRLVPPVVTLCMLSFAVAAAGPAGATSTAAGLPAVAAPGGPGTMSYFDLARKDCLGTARNTTYKAWYTVAGGGLSDVYEPTIDNTDVQTLQYIVTDGSTFTDLQTRDMTYTVAAAPSGMACTVTATSASHGYKLVTTYITDPARDTVLMDTRLDAPPRTR